jgi:hypothetical protein
MNKLGILGIVITIAFVAGIITANPGAEGVSGWQAAVIVLNGEISSIQEFLDENSDFFEFDLQLMSENIANNADDIADHEGRITVLENEVVSIMDQEGSCDDGQVPKFSAMTGDWSCQDDEAGDGGGESPEDPFILLMPLMEEPEPCTLATAGTIYYRDNSPVGESDAVCVCATDSSDLEMFLYRSLLSGSECVFDES